MKAFAMKQQRPMEKNICLWDCAVYIVLCATLFFQETFTQLVLLGSDSLNLAGTSSGSYSFIHPACCLPGATDFYSCSISVPSLMPGHFFRGRFSVFGTVGKTSE